MAPEFLRKRETETSSPGNEVRFRVQEVRIKGSEVPVHPVLFVAAPALDQAEEIRVRHQVVLWSGYAVPGGCGVVWCGVSTNILIHNVCSCS